MRCLKPNELKKPFYWNTHLGLMQIRYMGLLDSLKVRKESYPFRWTYQNFFEVYQDLDVGENGAKGFNTLVDEGSDFKVLALDLIKNCGVESSEEDILNGTTKIFLNEKFKIMLDKALLIKQKAKKDALAIIQRLYLSYKKKKAIREYFEQTGKCVAISRDLIKSWTAKLEGMKFRNYLKTTRLIQRRFREIKRKRQKRL